MFSLLQHSPEWWLAAASLLGGAWYYCVRPVGKLVLRAIHLAPVLSGADKSLARIESQLAEVMHEVQTNHGGSLKDAVKRIEENVKAVSEKTDAQTKDLTAQIRSVKATALQAQRAAIRAEKTSTQALEIVASK